MGIQLKNRGTKKTDDFRQFKTKIFTRTLIMVLAAIIIIWIVYSLFINQRFANGVVAIFENVFLMEYEDALLLYTHIFRNNYDIIVIAAITITFFVIFRFYLSSFSKYFIEINRGIDGLVKEDSGQIVLSSELAATEKKINLIKHTLEKRKIETQLAEQRKNDLIMYLAHDLKTPLASVIGYLNLLRDEGQISEELREKYLSISLNKAEHLEDLINEFFEISRFSLSHISLQYSEINLTRLLEQLIYEFRPMLKEKNLDCKLKIADNTMLRCDANKIQRTFDNLLRNAVIYSFNDTSINITAVQKNSNIIIKFTNQGNTIPKDKLERIFEQFFRLDASRSTRGGSGLGLAIAKQIIELHKGTIKAKSENDLIEFEVLLPVGNS